jgi:NTE family protein
MKRVGRIIRSVQAFGRGLSRLPATASPSSHRSAGIGLALGGGFARGIAHIGVLKVLEEESIPISYVAGTSVGALIGAIYCGGLPLAEIEHISSQVRFSTFARWTLSRNGFASNQRMTHFLHRVLKVKTFEELRIPLAVTATDFRSGEGVVFRSGSLVDPVRASCAYPGMFLPVKIGGRLLVDGMLAHAVPTVPLRQMGAERVLAVNLRGKWSGDDGPRNIFEVIGQCFAIAQEMNRSQWKPAADWVIEPDVNGYKYDCFENTPELVRAGELAARAALPEIRKWLQTEPAHPAEARKPRATRQVPAPVMLTEK